MRGWEVSGTQTPSQWIYVCLGMLVFCCFRWPEHSADSSINFRNARLPPGTSEQYVDGTGTSAAFRLRPSLRFEREETRAANKALGLNQH